MTGFYRGRDALGEAGPDLLGFEGMAFQLAKSLTDRALANGMVVGIEGKWGSGKSSLVDLTKRALKAHGATIQLDFGPWMVGARDQLLDAFFADLMRIIDSQAKQSGGQRFRKVAEEIKRFSAHLGRAAPMLKLLELGGLPTIFREGAERLTDLTKSGKSLSEMKAGLAEALAELDTRIIVFIDDVDRLEPGEVVEVLRLVRSVADFPNVVYVLCYDPDVVSEAITRETRAGDGRAYLAKIVQIALPVPHPEPLSLQSMFIAGVEEIEPSLDTDATLRLKTQLSLNPNRLTTPRDVNRVLDAVRFLWPALCGDVDFVDLAILQLIRNANPPLYAWIEVFSAYCAEMESGNADTRGHVEEELYDALAVALETDGASPERLPADLKNIAPDFKISKETTSARGGKPNRISMVYPKEDLAPLVAGRRLASPDHYRHYFALTSPKGAPLAADFQELGDALSATQDAAVRLLRSWSEQRTGFGTSKLAVVLRRLDSHNLRKLSLTEAKALLNSLAAMMDEIVDAEWTLEPGPDEWYYARRIVRELCYARLPGLGFFDLPDVYKDGVAISWLADMLRIDLRLRDGDQHDSFPKNVRCSIDAAFTARMEVIGWAAVFRTKRPLHVLECWGKMGFGKEARCLFAKGTTSDEDFIGRLEDMTQKFQTARGEGLSIPPSALEVVIDREAAKERLWALQENGNALEARSKSVWNAILDGENVDRPKI